MKKKLFLACLVLAMVIACVTNVLAYADFNFGETMVGPMLITITDNRSKTATASFSEEDFDVTGYIYENSIGDSLYYVIVTNNSEAAVEIEGSAVAYDKNNTPIGAGSLSISVLGPGETTIDYCYFDGVTGIDNVELQMNYSASRYYYPVINNLDAEVVLNDNNVVVRVTNTGETSAQFVEVHALFFDANNKVIYHDSTYVTDNDSEIKPGATLTTQLSVRYKDYDHVELYFTGRSDGRVTAPVEPLVTDADFTFKEYKYESSYASFYFLIIQNNSEYEVEFSANGTAFDAASNILGADDTEIDVIGPGQESICYFYFDNVSGIDHVEYQTTYAISRYYTDVIHGLDVQATLNDKNIVLTVKNNETIPAEFVEAYVLFFGQNGEIVDFNSTYITDNDSEIKPDASITEQISVYETFDTVEIYFTGRASK